MDGHLKPVPLEETGLHFFGQLRSGFVILKHPETNECEVWMPSVGGSHYSVMIKGMVYIFGYSIEYEGACSLLESEDPAMRAELLSEPEERMS